MLFAATRAPSGSNRQPFRFIVLTDGPVAIAAKRLVAGGARQMWEAKRVADGYDRGTGADSSSPKAGAWPVRCSTTSTTSRTYRCWSSRAWCATGHRSRRRARRSIRRARTSCWPPGPSATAASSPAAPPGRARTPGTARHPRRGLPGRHDHHRPARRGSRTGAAPTDLRVRVRRGLGRDAGLGGRSSRDETHVSRSPGGARPVSHRRPDSGRRGDAQEPSTAADTRLMVSRARTDSRWALRSSSNSRRVTTTAAPSPTREVPMIQRRGAPSRGSPAARPDGGWPGRDRGPVPGRYYPASEVSNSWTRARISSSRSPVGSSRA